MGEFLLRSCATMFRAADSVLAPGARWCDRMLLFASVDAGDGARAQLLSAASKVSGAARAGWPAGVMADVCDRRRRGWAPRDVWNANTWMGATLADALEVAAADTADPHLWMMWMDVAARLRLLACNDAIWWEGSELSPSPHEAGRAALVWLAGDDAAPALETVSLRRWAGAASGVLDELATISHGWPPRLADTFEQWQDQLRAAADTAGRWAGGDVDAGQQFFSWLCDTFDTLWD